MSELNTSTTSKAALAEIRELSDAEITNAAGAGWFRDAVNWIKEHITRGPGDVGVAVKGKF